MPFTSTNRQSDTLWIHIAQFYHTRVQIKPYCMYVKQANGETTESSQQYGAIKLNFKRNKQQLKLCYRVLEFHQKTH